MIRILGSIDGKEIVDSGTIVAHSGQKIVIRPLPNHEKTELEIRFIDSDDSKFKSKMVVEGELLVLQIAGRGFSDVGSIEDMESGNSSTMSLGYDDNYHYGMNYVINIFGSSGNKSISFSYTVIRTQKK